MGMIEPLSDAERERRIAELSDLFHGTLRRQRHELLVEFKRPKFIVFPARLNPNPEVPAERQDAKLMGLPIIWLDVEYPAVLA